MPEPNSSERERVQQQWNRRYRDTTTASTAARVLADNRHLLPDTGRALDLACGLGGNALLLAAHGLDTQAWDISDIAVTRLREQAQRQGLTLQAEVRDVNHHPPAPETFDVIVVSRFLERHLAPALIQALTPNGLLFYQTFVHQSADDYGPRHPAYRLDSQELLSLFHPLHIAVYREEGRIGDLTQGWRNEAMLVGQKFGQDTEETPGH